jgi:hypothetical protein
MLQEGAPMRIFFSAALVILTFATPATAATRNFGITSFEKVRVDGPFKIRLSTGVAPFAKASGSAVALDRVSVQVRGNTLVVQNNSSSWGGYPGQESGPVEISLGTHDLTSAWVNGSGSLAIDRAKGLKFDLSVQGSGAASIDQVDVDQLSINIVGTASAVLAGRTGKMTALVRGVSSLDAAGLATKDATVGAEGAATVKANITNAVTIDGSGPATVILAGGPSCTLRLHGSVSVSGCGQ